jgi:glycerol uptake facilitator-like aquaporin
MCQFRISMLYMIFHEFCNSLFWPGCVFAGIFIVATSYVTQRYLCVVFLVLGVGFSGINATGYAVNHLDIAPRYAGLLMGLSNTFGSMPGFLSPMLTGYIAHSKVTAVLFVIFKSSKKKYLVTLLHYLYVLKFISILWPENR